MSKLCRAKGEVYDFELMEELNSYIVVSLVFPGRRSLPSSSGQHYSLIDLLPVTSEFVGTTMGKSYWRTEMRGPE